MVAENVSCLSSPRIGEAVDDGGHSTAFEGAP